MRAPFVLRGLAAGRDDLGLDEVVFHDTDPERLELMTALGGHLCSEWGAGFTVRGESDARAALAGARFVFSAIRPGQEAARAVDEEVPLKHGVLGQETTGPGGFAMALRTIRHARVRGCRRGGARCAARELHEPRRDRDASPARPCERACCGFCDGPISMQRSIAEFLGLPRERVHADYFGLNHCRWIHRVLVDGQDRLPELLERFEELQAADEQWRLFEPDLVRVDRDAPDGVPVLLLLPGPGRRAHPRLGQLSRGRQLQLLNDALWPVLRRCVNGGDLDGARAAGNARWANVIDYFSRERGETPEGEPSTPATHSRERATLASRPR